MKWNETPQGKLVLEARGLSLEGNQEDSLVLLQRALECAPEDKWALTWHGHVLAALGRHDEALQSLRGALDVDENSVILWNELGALHDCMGFHRKAAFCYQQSAKITPGHEVLMVLNDVKVRRAGGGAERTEESAKTPSDEERRQVGEERRRLAGEAQALRDEGKHEKALAVWDQALELGDHARLLTFRGRELLDLGRNGEAEEAFTRAVRADKDIYHAWPALGFLKKDKEMYVTAAHCFEQAVRISPRFSNLTVLAALQVVFDPESALINAERALAMDPEWEEAQNVRESAKREIQRLKEEQDDESRE